MKVLVLFCIKCGKNTKACEIHTPATKDSEVNKEDDQKYYECGSCGHQGQLGPKFTLL